MIQELRWHRRVRRSAAYGQFKANAPCLNNILALGESRSGFMDEMTPPSPLAMQAKRILRDGGAMTLRSIQEAQTQARGSDLRAWSQP